MCCVCVCVWNQLEIKSLARRFSRSIWKRLLFLDDAMTTELSRAFKSLGIIDVKIGRENTLARSSLVPSSFVPMLDFLFDFLFLSLRSKLKPSLYLYDNGNCLICNSSEHFSTRYSCFLLVSFFRFFSIND